MSSDEALTRAGDELFDRICSVLADERGVHLETAIAGAGSLAGAALLAGTGIDLSSLEPGSVVFGPDFDESGPNLLGALAALCGDQGVQVTFDAMGRPVPKEHEPHRDFLGLMTLLLPAFGDVMRRNRIPKDEAPLAAVRAAARLIVSGRDTLNPSIGAAIAANAIIEGAKRVPPRPE